MKNRKRRGPKPRLSFLTELPVIQERSGCGRTPFRATTAVPGCMAIAMMPLFLVFRGVVTVFQMFFQCFLFLRTTGFGFFFFSRHRIPPLKSGSPNNLAAMLPFISNSSRCPPYRFRWIQPLSRRYRLHHSNNHHLPVEMIRHPGRVYIGREYRCAWDSSLSQQALHNQKQHLYFWSQYAFVKIRRWTGPVNLKLSII